MINIELKIWDARREQPAHLRSTSAIVRGFGQYRVGVDIINTRRISKKTWPPSTMRKRVVRYR